MNKRLYIAIRRYLLGYPVSPDNQFFEYRMQIIRPLNKKILKCFPEKISLLSLQHGHFTRQHREHLSIIRQICNRIMVSYSLKGPHSTVYGTGTYPYRFLAPVS